MGSFSPSDFLGPQPLARLLMDEFLQLREGGSSFFGVHQICSILCPLWPGLCGGDW